MNDSGSLCPATKAAEIIGDKWTLLILRELFLGSSKFGDFQRGLPRISPTILSKRLKKLEEDGLIIRKTGPGEKTREYRLTRCGRETGAIIDHMATWGLRWARRRIRDEDLDVGAFMWDFHRTLNVEELPDGETVLCVKYPDVPAFGTWWLVVNDKVVDLCTDDPGKDIDLYIASNFESMVGIWMGDVDVKTAVASDELMLTGAAHLMRSVVSWFPRSNYADIRPVRLLEQPPPDRPA